MIGSLSRSDFKRPSKPTDNEVLDKDWYKRCFIWINREHRGRCTCHRHGRLWLGSLRRSVVQYAVKMNRKIQAQFERFYALLFFDLCFVSCLSRSRLVLLCYSCQSVYECHRTPLEVTNCLMSILARNRVDSFVSFSTVSPRPSHGCCLAWSNGFHLLKVKLKENRFTPLQNLFRDNDAFLRRDNADRISYQIKLHKVIKEFDENFLPHMHEEENVSYSPACSFDDI